MFIIPRDIGNERGVYTEADRKEAARRYSVLWSIAIIVLFLTAAAIVVSSIGVATK